MPRTLWPPVPLLPCGPENHLGHSSLLSPGMASKAPQKTGSHSQFGTKVSFPYMRLETPHLWSQLLAMHRRELTGRREETTGTQWRPQLKAKAIDSRPDAGWGQSPVETGSRIERAEARTRTDGRERGGQRGGL